MKPRHTLPLSLLLLLSACSDFEAPSTPISETTLQPLPPPPISLPLFDVDSVWNTPIDANAPIDPESDTMIKRLILENEQGANVDISVHEWSVTVFFADENTPRMDVELIQYWWSYYRTIKDVPILPETVPDPAGDGHLAIIDLAEGYAYEFWQAEKHDNGRWAASWGNRIALDSNGIYPTGNSSRGSGFASLAGMIWPEEFAQGKIEHALVVSIPSTKKSGPVPPATETDGRRSYWGAIPIGARIQLNPELDLDNFEMSTYERIISESLQEYGAYVGDTSGSIEFEAINPLSYTNDPYQGMFDEHWILLDNIPLEEMRVLELHPEIDDPELSVEDESIYVLP